MRKLVKCGHDKYIEVDTDTEKAVTRIMTRDEAHSYLHSKTWDDNANYLLETADKEYAAENAEAV